MQSKLISTALAAFGVGAVVSWAVTADAHERRLIRELEAALKIIGDKNARISDLTDGINFLSDEYVKAKAGEVPDVNIDQLTLEPDTVAVLDGQIEDLPEDPYEGEPGEEIVREIDQKSVPDEAVTEEARSHLQSIIDRYTMDDDEVSRQFVDKVIVDDGSPPFVISREEFAAGEAGEDYSKITLEYYPRDRVLLDDSEDPVDVLNLVGWNSLKKFGHESEDESVVFVRNHRLQTDFEVVKKDQDELPKHVYYGMEKDEFESNKAAGLIRLPREDQ